MRRRTEKNRTHREWQRDLRLGICTSTYATEGTCIAVVGYWQKYTGQGSVFIKAPGTGYTLADAKKNAIENCFAKERCEFVEGHRAK